GLAAGRDMLVADDVPDRRQLVDGAQQRHERIELRGLEPVTLESLELDADRPAVAVVAPFPARLAGMPCAVVDGDELQQLAVAPDDEVGRDLEAADRLEVRMRRPVERVREEPLDRVATVFAGWQADAVQHDEIDRRGLRAWAEVRRRHASRATPPARVPLHGAHGATLRAARSGMSASERPGALMPHPTYRTP